MRPIQAAAGVLSPHIDYARGGLVYAATWKAAREAVASAEVVVIFGTDHAGSPGQLTPTAQRYATPWGVLPVDTGAVAALARALGDGRAFAEELHHRREHSIELACVWLHWALRQAGKAEADWPPLVPILCGSFQCYTLGGGPPAALPSDGAEAPDLPDAGQTLILPPTVTPAARPASSLAGAAPQPLSLPDQEPHLAAALDALAGAVGGRRVLVVSAADLAHVGPAFGDAAPLGAGDRDALVTADAALLAAACSGDAPQFLALLRAERDRRRVCGLPPTYWAMRLLERLTGRPLPGRVAGYALCPADERAGSVVSIAGVLWETP
jgi:predicted class III extradiol MEMO1 family dioxygenase